MPGQYLSPSSEIWPKQMFTEYPNTLHKLQNLHLNVRMVIAGHWSAVHGPELIDHYLDLLAESKTVAK